jgi:hypothetical protein
MKNDHHLDERGADPHLGEQLKHPPSVRNLLGGHSGQRHGLGHGAPLLTGAQPYYQTRPETGQARPGRLHRAGHDVRAGPARTHSACWVLHCTSRNYLCACNMRYVRMIHAQRMRMRRLIIPNTRQIHPSTAITKKISPRGGLISLLLPSSLRCRARPSTRSIYPHITPIVRPASRVLYGVPSPPPTHESSLSQQDFYRSLGATIYRRKSAHLPRRASR